MPRQKPVIRHQDELDWEGWTDPDLAAKSPCRWRLLVTGERDSSSGLVTGIAELPPACRFPSITTNLRKPIMSSAAAVTLRLTIPRHPLARAQPSTSRLTPSIPSAAPVPSRWFLYSASPATGSTKTCIISMRNNR